MALYPQLHDIGGKPAWSVYKDLTQGGGGGGVGGGGGGGPAYSMPGQGGAPGTPANSFQEGINRYLKDMPGDPESIYESQMGPIRKDINDRINQTGLNLQSVASRTGQSYGDLMSRYLPEAFKPMGQAAAQAAGQAQQFSQQRYQMAAQLSQAEKMMEWDKQKFYDGLKQQAANLEKELASRYRIAMAQASSAREQAMIQANFQMERERLAQQMQWQSVQFQQAQANWRASQQLQLYDKYYGQQGNAQMRNDILAGANTWEEYRKKHPINVDPWDQSSFYQDESGTWYGQDTGPAYSDLTPYNYGGYGSH